MTLIVGMKCRDGIVVGADTLASTPTCSGVNVTFTIDKVHPIGNSTLFAAAGAVSTIQRVHDALLDYKYELDKGLTLSLRDAIINDLAAIYSKRAEVFKAFHSGEEAGWSADVIIATTKRKGEESSEFVLWHIAKDLNDEIVNCMNYYTTGIGDLSASTLLKLFYHKEIAVKDAIPVVKEVILRVGDINALVNKETNIWFLDKDGVHKHVE
jgi:20S proteasome alpha/beta subunit